MKKAIILFLTLALCVVTLFGCESTPKTSSTSTDETDVSNTQRQVLKVALDAYYKPMEYLENDKVVGFSADLANAIGKEIGYDVQLSNVAWEELFDSLYAGKYDVIISSVTITSERQESMLFSDSYYTSSPIILSLKSENITSAADLKNKTVSVQDGTTAHEIISTTIAGVNVKAFASVDEALAAFASGEVNAVVMDSPVIRDYAKQKNNPDYVIVEDNEAFPEEEFGIAANKTNQELITKINSALSKLKSNGEYDKIYNKYFM